MRGRTEVNMAHCSLHHGRGRLGELVPHLWDLLPDIQPGHQHELRGAHGSTQAWGEQG